MVAAVAVVVHNRHHVAPSNCDIERVEDHHDDLLLHLSKLRLMQYNLDIVAVDTSVADIYLHHPSPKEDRSKNMTVVVPAAVAVLIESAAGQEVSGLAYKHWHKVVVAADLEMMPAPVPVVVVVVAVVARYRTFVVVVVERPIVVVYDAAVAVADDDPDLVTVPVEVLSIDWMILLCHRNGP